MSSHLLRCKFLLVLFLYGAAYAECPTKFFAKPITYEEVSSLNFYFTSTHISSTAECATFCTKRQFCRTAIFNEFVGTCSLSDDWKVDCRKHSERYEWFVAAKKRLILVACAESCKSEPSLSGSNRSDKSIKNIIVSDIHTGKLWAKMDPHDGNVPTNYGPSSKTKYMDQTVDSKQGLKEDDTSESSSVSAQRRPQYVYRVILDRFNGDQRRTLSGGGHEEASSNESYRTFPERPPKEISSSKYAISSAKKSTAEEQSSSLLSRTGEAFPETFEEKSNSKNKLKNADESFEERPYEDGELLFPQREWKKISAPKKLSDIDNGFLNKVIIEGIHSDYSQTISDNSNEKILNERGNSLKGSRSEVAACFDMVNSQFLLNAGYEMHADVSREECRCLCAESWIAKSSARKCKSFQYNAFRECLLNKDDHFGKFDLVYDASAEYHFINCSQPFFSAQILNDCPKQLHDIVGEHSASEQFSHSFKASLPAAPFFAANYQKRTTLADLLRDDSSTATTVKPTPTSRITATTIVPPTAEVLTETASTSGTIGEVAVTTNPVMTTSAGLQPTTLEIMFTMPQFITSEAKSIESLTVDMGTTSAIADASITPTDGSFSISQMPSSQLPEATDDATSSSTINIISSSYSTKAPTAVENDPDKISTIIASTFSSPDEPTIRPTEAREQNILTTIEDVEKAFLTTTTFSKPDELIKNESRTPLLEKDKRKGDFEIAKPEINEWTSQPTKAPAQGSANEHSAETSADLSSTTPARTLSTDEPVGITASINEWTVDSTKPPARGSSDEHPAETSTDLSSTTPATTMTTDESVGITASINEWTVESTKPPARGSSDGHPAETSNDLSSTTPATTMTTEESVGITASINEWTVVSTKPPAQGSNDEHPAETSTDLSSTTPATTMTTDESVGITASINEWTVESTKPPARGSSDGHPAETSTDLSSTTPATTMTTEESVGITASINEWTVVSTKPPAQGSNDEHPAETSTDLSSTTPATTMTTDESVAITASILPESEGDDEEEDRGRSTSSHLDKPNENSIAGIFESEIPGSKTSSTPWDSCFEIVDGYVMKSTAGGLENDVSLEECQCFCATSRASARYSFQCASATYYHNERDCILNLDNRRQRPDLFRENSQKPFNVSYLGMLCSSDESIERLPNEVRESGCRMATSLKPPTTTTPTATKSVSGKYTDSCFLELPNFVLEGTALAVEDNTTIEECKCYCINAQIRYGTECQSLQYYFDSKTCLINRENRISNLDRFNFAPATTMRHSYFDFRCATDQTVLSIYVEEVCSTVADLKPKIKIIKNDVSFESQDRGNDGPENGKVFQDEIRIAPPQRPHSKIVNAPTETTSNTEKTSSTQPSSMIHPEKMHTKTISSHITTIITTTYSPWKFEEPDDGSYYEAEEIYDEIEPTKSRLSTRMVAVLSSLATSTDGNFTTTVPSLTLTATTFAPTMSSTNLLSSTYETSTTTQADNFITATHQTSTTYIPAGPCTYSAIYQTSFKGSKLLKRVLVSSPAQCFSGCYHEGCRSANLIQFSGVLKYCELYRDALIDYRTPDVLGFDSSSVYFDGIKCEGNNS